MFWTFSLMSNILIKFFFFFFLGAPLLLHYGWLNGKYGKGRKEKEEKKNVFGCEGEEKGK